MCWANLGGHSPCPATPEAKESELEVKAIIRGGKHGLQWFSLPPQACQTQEGAEWCRAQALVPTVWVRILALGLEYGNLSCLISMNFSFLICEKGKLHCRAMVKIE